MYPSFPKLLSHPGCHITEVHVLYSKSLLFIHFKYSRVYMGVWDGQKLPTSDKNTEHRIRAVPNLVCLVFYLIISAKTLFPNQVIFRGPGS